MNHQEKGILQSYLHISYLRVPCKPDPTLANPLPYALVVYRNLPSDVMLLPISASATVQKYRSQYDCRKFKIYMIVKQDNSLFPLPLPLPLPWEGTWDCKNCPYTPCLAIKPINM